MSERSSNGISKADHIAPVDRVFESNHRIANNLTILAGLIRTELSTIATDAQPNARYVRHLLEQISLRIDSVGRLHRLLTSTGYFSNVSLCAYLEEIIDAAKHSLTNSDHTSILFIPQCEASIPVKQAVAVGLFVSEALVNSLKYAHPSDEFGRIQITCGRAKLGGVLIEILDDGEGLPTELAPPGARTTGTGTRLMHVIAHDLGAELRFAKGHPGHIVRLELPLSLSPQ